MKQVLYSITSNEKIADRTFLMTLAGDTSAFTAPGQFLNIKIEGCYLRRPISVCDRDDAGLTIIYKTVGEGTAAMSRLLAGDTLDALTGLGNGFDISLCRGRTLLIGGGVGVPPLYGLCRRLREKGGEVIAALGFSTASEVFLADGFTALGADTRIATADGSLGAKGFVTDIIKDVSCDYFCVCGPEAMYAPVDRLMTSSGQYSFEERMGCGFGACMGCSCETKYGAKRICRDGPVLVREEIVW